MQNTLINVIENSLTAATSALSLLKQTVQPETMPAPEVAPVVQVEVQAPPVVEVPKVILNPNAPAPLSDYERIDILVEMLEHPDYRKRSVAELSAKTGWSPLEIQNALDDADYKYTIYNRRSDGAKLIGLDSRN